MRIILSVLLLIFLVAAASAQSLIHPLVPPEVIVIKQTWRNEIRNPALDANPFQNNMEQQQLVLDREETARLNQIRIKQGLPTERVPVRVRPFEGRAKDVSSVYIYEAKFKNTGAKKIRALAWEYVFFELETKQEAGRIHFISEISLRPGKTKNLVMHSVAPPTATINASKVDKKFRQKYIERVSILGIEYEDGSLWLSNKIAAK